MVAVTSLCRSQTPSYLTQDDYDMQQDIWQCLLLLVAEIGSRPEHSDLALMVYVLTNMVSFEGSMWFR
jgi:hypothetical protein